LDEADKQDALNEQNAPNDLAQKNLAQKKTTSGLHDKKIPKPDVWKVAAKATAFQSAMRGLAPACAPPHTGSGGDEILLFA
jgi:hypothetical protein